MRIRCRSEAEFSVKALVPVVGSDDDTPPVEFYPGVKLCSRCAQRLKNKDILNSDVRECICELLESQGTEGRPDFDRAQLIIISMDDAQLLQLEANYATIH